MLKQCVKPLYLLSLMLLPFSLHAFEPGQKLVLLTNLHPDINKRYLYTMNYQLAHLIPMCSEITVVEKEKDALVFTWQNVQYIMAYEKYTKKAGVAFDTVMNDFFGSTCDKDKVAKMSEIDQKGIRKGIPYVGMTREGILYAMGRPPYHANRTLEGHTYMYWLNRFKRMAIDFDEKGIVEDIRL